MAPRLILFAARAAADFELHTDMTSDARLERGVTRKVKISRYLGLKMIHCLSDGLLQRSQVLIDPLDLLSNRFSIGSFRR